MLMMLTRTGDVLQSDRTGANGLRDLVHKIHQAKLRNISNPNSRMIRMILLIHDNIAS